MLHVFKFQPFLDSTADTQQQIQQEPTETVSTLLEILHVLQAEEVRQAEVCVSTLLEILLPQTDSGMCFLP